MPSYSQANDDNTIYTQGLEFVNFLKKELIGKYQYQKKLIDKYQTYETIQKPTINVGNMIYSLKLPFLSENPNRYKVTLIVGNVKERYPAKIIPFIFEGENKLKLTVQTELLLRNISPYKNTNYSDVYVKLQVEDINEKKIITISSESQGELWTKLDSSKKPLYRESEADIAIIDLLAEPDFSKIDMIEKGNPTNTSFLFDRDSQPQPGTPKFRSSEFDQSMFAESKTSSLSSTEESPYNWNQLSFSDLQPTNLVEAETYTHEFTEKKSLSFERKSIKNKKITAEINDSLNQPTHKRTVSMPNLPTKDVFTQINTTETTETDDPLYDQEDNASKEIKEEDHVEDIAQNLPANQESKHDSQALVKFIDWEKIMALVEKLGGTFKEEDHIKDENPFVKFTKGSEQYTLSQNNGNGVITLLAQNSSFKQFAKTLTALVAAKIQSQPGEGVTVTFKHVGNATKEEYLSALEELKALEGGECNVTINKGGAFTNEAFDKALHSIEKLSKPMLFKEKTESKPAESDPMQEAC